MIITSIILTDTDTYTASIDGSVWFGITPVSRFYKYVQDAIADGEPVSLPQAPVEPIPNLSFAQLLIGLVTEQWITEDEGDAWLSGSLPSAVLALIDSLPIEQRFTAKARALRPSEVVRSDYLVNAMATASGKSDDDIDNFFRTYSGV